MTLVGVLEPIKDTYDPNILFDVYYFGLVGELSHSMDRSLLLGRQSGDPFLELVDFPHAIQRLLVERQLLVERDGK